MDQLLIDDSATAEGPEPATPVVALRGISKHYAGARALEDVSLAIAPGTVHALVGENGAGKSTLGKVIAGSVRPDEGQLFVDGRPVDYASPLDALADGVAAMQQEIALLSRRSVLENVFLGIESTRGGWINERDMRRRFDELRLRVPFTIDPDAIVASLRLADQQKVEVMRAVARNARLIVMDEPTAALSPEEVEGLMIAVRALRERGAAIVYVSHFLNEVLSIADTVTVLRDGRVVATAASEAWDHDSLLQKMLGRSMTRVFPPRADAGERVVLRARGIARANAIDDVSLEVREGEILGIAGLVGSGRSELARALCGVDPRDAGEIEVDGAPVRLDSPRDAMRTGIAMLPESRKDQGLFMKMNTAANITLPRLAEMTRGGILNRRGERRRVDELLARFDIRPATPDSTVSELSGGNQQKALLARWLVRTPKVLIADEPTRGVDIGAKTAIYGILAQLASEGMALIVISSELEEILGLSHRIVVMHRGAIAAEFTADEATEAAVLNAAFGRPQGRANTQEEEQPW
jgi:ABC-type sugar transport system ATPase subunit